MCAALRRQRLSRDLPGCSLLDDPSSKSCWGPLAANGVRFRHRGSHRHVTSRRSMLDGITPAHLIIVLVVALLILGPGKLPETGAALGKAMREFRHGM